MGGLGKLLSLLGTVNDPVVLALVLQALRNLLIEGLSEKCSIPRKYINPITSPKKLQPNCRR